MSGYCRIKEGEIKACGGFWRVMSGYFWKLVVDMRDDGEITYVFGFTSFICRHLLIISGVCTLPCTS